MNTSLSSPSPSGSKPEVSGYSQSILIDDFQTDWLTQLKNYHTSGDIEVNLHVDAVVNVQQRRDLSHPVVEIYPSGKPGAVYEMEEFCGSIKPRLLALLKQTSEKIDAYILAALQNAVKYCESPTGVKELILFKLADARFGADGSFGGGIYQFCRLLPQAQEKAIVEVTLEFGRAELFRMGCVALERKIRAQLTKLGCFDFSIDYERSLNVQGASFECRFEFALLYEFLLHQLDQNGKPVINDTELFSLSDLSQSAWTNKPSRNEQRRKREHIQ